MLYKMRPTLENDAKDGNIDKSRIRRRSLRQGISLSWRAPREYFVLLLLVVSHSRFGRTMAIDITSAPSSESSMESSFEDSMNGTFSEIYEYSLAPSSPPTNTQQISSPSDTPTVATESRFDENDMLGTIPGLVGGQLDGVNMYGNATFAQNSTNSTLNATDATPNATLAPGSIQPTQAPTQLPTYRKTFMPTGKPASSPSENSQQPTAIDTGNRQDTPSPGAPDIAVPTTFPPIATNPPTASNALTDPGTPATPNPTREPTTKEPTPFPTQRPTRLPTPEPTQATPFPTMQPTMNPTEPPTRAPTNPPTVSPTTKAPTPQPSPGPTVLPTASPTSQPSFHPSNAPTTLAPTAATMMPSVQPSNLPSVAPSVSAAPTTRTPRPTISSQPSDLPSISPTHLPSMSPSWAPSSQPSVSPSALPSSSPSEAPSRPLQNNGERVDMTLRYCQELEGLSIITWEQITATHIRQAIVSSGVEPPLEDLRVWTNIVQQNPVIILNDSGSATSTVPAPSTTTTASLPTSAPTNVPAVRGRLLQQAERQLPLRIAFDTAISFRSATSDHDIQKLIADAFNTGEERDRYLEMLRRTNDGAFQDLEEIVSVSVGGMFVPEVNRPNGNSRGDGDGTERDMTLFIIIGSVAGGAALILLILLFVGRKYMRQDQSEPGVQKTYATTDDYNGSNGNGVTAEIVVDNNRDEVSTLGDPMYLQGGGMMINHMERDEHTASIGDDYDYKYLKHHNFNQNNSSRDRMLSEDNAKSRETADESLARDSSNVTGSQSKIGALSQMGESIFSDDASFEEQFNEPEQQVPFEIIVPAGKLGMVIDTPNGGFPIVHAIKDTSILADRVRVGDRLVSVDGQDCTTMTAVQVSKLISLKSDQESRVLVFVRSKAIKPRAAE